MQGASNIHTRKGALKNVQSGTKSAGTINLVPLKMLHRHYAPANEIQ